MLLADSSPVYYWMNAYCIVICVYCTSMQKMYRYRYIYVLIHVMLHHYVLIHVIPYYYFLLFMILKDVAFDSPCMLYMSLVCHYVCVFVFTLAIILLLFHSERFISGDDRLSVSLVFTFSLA